MTRAIGLAVFAAVLAACSPVYVYKSAAGEAKLLWRRKSIAQALKDPKTDPALKKQLQLVEDIRAFAFDDIHLKRSKDFSTYSRVDGKYITYLITASRKTKLEAKIWSFPLAGSFPYKGFFKKADAQREKAQLEKDGWDVSLRGVSDYHTPVFNNPVPTSVLDYPPGDLADLIIHELAHGTVYFKDQSDFDEGLATFIGDNGAEQFLTAQYGPNSAELAQFKKDQADDKAIDDEMADLRQKLEKLYGSPVSDAEKLRLREPIFAEAKKKFEADGWKIETLNNAVVVGEDTYRQDLSVFRKAYDHVGGDWAKFVDLLKSLNHKNPLPDLQSRLLR